MLSIKLCMVGENTSHRHVSDEDRREFLKVLGVTGAVAAGSATLSEVRDAASVTTETAAELAPIGEAIRADLAGSLDAGLLTSQQTAFASTASALPAIVERGLPVDAPRKEFQQVAAEGRPVYDHLLEVGFFESTTEHLPEFTSAYIEESVRRFVDSEPLAAPLGVLGFTDQELVDLGATAIAHREDLGDRHWIATDELPREQMEIGAHIPPMTQGAAGGALLWFEDLDTHLWQQQVLLTDEILADTVWDARAMAAGVQLMTEGATRIAEGDAELAHDELAALLSSGFALQTIAQNLLVQDAYWITEEMRAPRKPLAKQTPFGGD